MMLVAQHAHLDESIAALDGLRPRWRAGASPADRDALAATIASMSVALDAHMADEEEEVLSLIEQHLTPAEWKMAGEQGAGTIPTDIHAWIRMGELLEDATATERRRLLGQLPAPARLLWRTAGERVYAAYRDRIRKG